MSERSDILTALGDSFDPWDETYLSDPYPTFAEARAATPLFFASKLDYWVVTRYRDIQDIFRDVGTYSAANVLAPFRPVCPAAQHVLKDSGFRPVRVLTDNDPPSHSRARKLTSLAFTPKRVASMESVIRMLATRMIDAFIAKGSADLVRDLAWDLPVLVLFKVLGVPDEDVPRVKGGSGSRLLFLWGRPTDDEQEELARGMTVFWRYARELVKKRFASPTDDFTSDLINARDGDLAVFSEDEIVSILVILLAAGHETTTGLLGNAMRQLLTHRQAWDAICADPSLIPGAVEEVLRFDAPVVTWRRITNHPVELAGTALPAKSNLMMLLGAGNRDPEVFANPEVFDIRRANAKDHLTLGYGPHFCLGAALARLEARVMLEELTRRIPDLTMVKGQTMQFAPNTTFRAPLGLQATWGARS